MKFDIVKYLGIVGTAAGISFLAAPMAQAGSYLDELQVKDTCGTSYADKLASCTPFRCTRPSPMAMMFGFPSKDEIAKMPPERQQKMNKMKTAAEKKMAAMSAQERAALKSKMISALEIKGYDAQGRCQTETGVMPNILIRCAYDAPMLKRVSDFQKMTAKAGHVETHNSSGMVNGKWVSKTITKVDGKIVDNPMAEGLQSGICKTLQKDVDRGWVTLDKLNRMAHIELNLSEHGKHVAGHVRVLNAADGKVVFDKDVATNKEQRKINLEPGTYDIEISSKNPKLAPVQESGVKLGHGNVFKKDIEFYAITGTLKLTVNVNGQPANMAVYMYEAETHQWLVLKASTFGKKPSFYFKSFSIKLPETLTGKYEVFVTPITGIGFEPPAKAKYKKFLLTIKNGDMAEKTVDFPLNKPSTLSNAASTQTAQAREAKAINPGANRTKDNTPPAQPQAGESAGQSSNTLFILDASGSMWGQIKGKPKITIAKEVMAKLVPELPGSSRIGLIAYGHRRKGDCNDVETLVKLTANDKQAVLKAVNGLNAKGKTPLTRSVNQAIDMLRPEENASTVVLISDGIESCGGDPCAAVKAAKASGVNFILHTVGFGLSKKEGVQLQCMAKAGGGQYFQANNAEELLKSARKAVQPAGILKLTVKVNGSVTNLGYRIEDTKTGKIISEPVLPTPSGMPIRLAGGQYNVFVSPAGVSGAGEQKLSLNIKAGEVVERVLKFGKGILHLTVMVNDKPAHAYIHVENSITHKGTYESSVFGYDTPLNINMAAGKVDVVVRPDGRNIPEQRVNGVEIVAGETTDLVIPVEVKKPTPVTTDANGMEQDTDRPWNDFRDFVPQAADPVLCQTACEKDAQCKAWTYVKPNTQGRTQPHCYLKSPVPSVHHDTCCVSGLKH